LYLRASIEVPVRKGGAGHEVVVGLMLPGVYMEIAE
jgi:hypothetical protein